MISLRAFYKSLGHALRGLSDLFMAEQSFRLQVFAGAFIFVLSLVLPLELWKQVLLFLLVVSVLVLEIINSIIERVADAVQPRLSPMVREIKDMMAGAVLLSSFVAAVVGVVILYAPLRDVVCAILSICKL